MSDTAQSLVFSCIVEGHGETGAVPELIRRIASITQPNRMVQCPAPLRVKRDRFLKFQDENDFHRYLLLAAGKLRQCDGAVFILLDSEGDCPADRAKEIRRKAVEVIGHVSVHVVLAHHMYENWFISAAESLAGHQGLQEKLDTPENPENPSGKGWISQNMSPGRTYTEPIDQAELTRIFDLDAAMACRSFRKCRKEIESVLS